MFLVLLYTTAARGGKRKIGKLVCNLRSYTSQGREERAEEVKGKTGGGGGGARVVVI